jgi:hypothetical protein
MKHSDCQREGTSSRPAEIEHVLYAVPYTINRDIVLHVALRAPYGTSICVDGHDVVPDVHDVLQRMAEFRKRVRSGIWTGHTGKGISQCFCFPEGGAQMPWVLIY